IDLAAFILDPQPHWHAIEHDGRGLAVWSRLAPLVHQLENGAVDDGIGDRAGARCVPDIAVDLRRGERGRQHRGRDQRQDGDPPEDRDKSKPALAPRRHCRWRRVCRAGSSRFSSSVTARDFCRLSTTCGVSSTMSSVRSTELLLVPNSPPSTGISDTSRRPLEPRVRLSLISPPSAIVSLSCTAIVLSILRWVMVGESSVDVLVVETSLTSCEMSIVTMPPWFTRGVTLRMMPVARYSMEFMTGDWP